VHHRIVRRYTDLSEEHAVSIWLLAVIFSTGSLLDSVFKPEDGAGRFSGSSINLTTRRYIPLGNSLHSHRYENPKSSCQFSDRGNRVSRQPPPQTDITVNTTRAQYPELVQGSFKSCISDVMFNSVLIN
jgi:hypothetical protein